MTRDTTATVTVEHDDGTVEEDLTTDEARALALFIGTGQAHVDVDGVSVAQIDRVKDALQSTPEATEPVQSY